MNSDMVKRMDMSTDMSMCSDTDTDNKHVELSARPDSKAAIHPPVCLKSWSTIVSHCMPLVEQWMTLVDDPQSRNEQVELEVRLGRYDVKTKQFTSGVAEYDYVKLYDAMKQNPTWSTPPSLDESFVDDQYNYHIRRRWNRNMIDKTFAPFVKKTLLQHTIIKTNTMYDLYVSLVNEIVIAPDSVPKSSFIESVSKCRHTFTHRNAWQYSLTRFSKSAGSVHTKSEKSAGSDASSVKSASEHSSEQKYEVEVELGALSRVQREEYGKHTVADWTSSLLWKASHILYLWNPQKHLRHEIVS
jgi:hypothetical protein